MASLVELPDDSLTNIASFLSAPDLLTFLSSHPHVNRLSSSESFWLSLTRRSSGTTCLSATTGSTRENLVISRSNYYNNGDGKCHAAQHAKRQFLLQAYTNSIPAVEWKPVLCSRLCPVGREGHLACNLGGRRLVLTGGFTDDECVYVLDVSSQLFHQQRQQQQHPPPPVLDWQKLEPTNVEPRIHPDEPEVVQQQRATVPAGRRRGGLRGAAMDADLVSTPSHVYGASLTALDDRRAIRFGGFKGGGYTAECSELVLLTVDYDDGDVDNNRLKATWQVIYAPGNVLPRAYHSATLLLHRYLVVLGGMTSTGCILGEAILDTHTWTWFTDNPVTLDMKLPKPAARHGHSAVLDEKRNRLVIFGGGSGSDLLRSGRDNAEIWSLSLGPGWNTATTPEEFQQSLPWEWRLLLLNEYDSDDEDSDSGSDVGEDDIRHNDHERNRSMEDGGSESYASMPPLEPRNGGGTAVGQASAVDGGDHESGSSAPIPGLVERGGGAGDHDSAMDHSPIPNPDTDDDNESFVSAEENSADMLPELIRRPQRSRTNRLTEVERLSLGRCHLGFKVGDDTVILAFGSGRPSTNGVVGYNLATDTFFRPKLVGDVLPPPRFTAAGTLFGNFNSYMLVHGGYNSQESVAIGNMAVLDLAPLLERELVCLNHDPNFESYPPVTRDDVARHSIFGGPHAAGMGGMEDLLQNLFVEITGGAIMPRMNPPGVARARTLGEILRALENRPRQQPGDDDDDDDNEIGLGGVVQRVGFGVDSDDDDNDDEESGLDDLSEVS